MYLKNIDKLVFNCIHQFFFLNLITLLIRFPALQRDNGNEKLFIP